LPFVFAGSALASGAGLALALSPASTPAGSLRRAAVAGALLEVGAAIRMERQLAELAEPFHSAKAGVLRRVALGATAAGAVAAAAARRPPSRVAAGFLLLSGAAAERFAVFHAGVASAKDPKYTVGPQRRRLREAAQRDR
jgi:hypothetical protein